MTDQEKRSTSLASELDQTRWDYQPRKDRMFLLAPLARLMGSIVWEFRPKHLRPAWFQDEPEIEEEIIEEDDVASSESADRMDRDR